MSGARETRTLQTLVRERIDRWREEGEPNAAEVLAEHPELRGAKSLVMDLVLAEYSLRTAAGDAVERDEFCDRFPTFRQSIAKMLDVQDFLDKCPGSAAADGAAEDAGRWPLLGQEFLGYELVEPLGRGGLARVYLARETKLGGRWVVVKLSRHGSREAAALGKLSHPSVVPIYSVKHDAADEWTLICMPLVGVATGIDLLDAAFAAGTEKNGALVERVAVETKPLTPIQETRDTGQGTGFDWNLTYGEAVARLGVQLAEGLQAAHAAGIMHGDIKPSNILLAWSGRAMLLDFNLAIDASAGSDALGGTLAYMAPEMMECMREGRGAAARRLDPRCDVYSLGAVLFELLTGRLPAEPKNAERLSPAAYQPWLDCKRARPEAPAEAGVDPRLMAIVLKCLEFNPEARQANAAELAAELRTFLERAARPRVMQKRARRAVLAAALALLVIGGGMWAYVGSRPLTVEQLYRQGLAEYEQGKYGEAVETFSQCLERRSGWTEALFGRGQALLRLQKWSEARTDFTALFDADPAWADGLAGYCSMKLRDQDGAFAKFMAARREGLRDLGFLLNYARVESNRQRHSEAIKLYDEILAIDPTNALAYRNRGLAYVAIVWSNKNKTVDQQALADADECCRLEPSSFESACCAAIIYGEAVRKEAKFQEKAVYYLNEALRKGMPIEAANPYPPLKRILGLVDETLLPAVRHDAKYVMQFTPAHEPPSVADWNAFQKSFGLKRERLAHND